MFSSLKLNTYLARFGKYQRRISLGHNLPNQHKNQINQVPKIDYSKTLDVDPFSMAKTKILVRCRRIEFGYRHPNRGVLNAFISYALKRRYITFISKEIHMLKSRIVMALAALSSSLVKQLLPKKRRTQTFLSMVFTVALAPSASPCLCIQCNRKTSWLVTLGGAPEGLELEMEIEDETYKVKGKSAWTGFSSIIDHSRQSGFASSLASASVTSKII